MLILIITTIEGRTEARLKYLLVSSSEIICSLNMLLLNARENTGET